MQPRVLRAVKPESEPHPLDEFAVNWLAPSAGSERALRTALKSAKNENKVQSVLRKHSILLGRVVGGGHGRWVIPKPKLGAEFIPDFVIGTKSSLGYEWVVVELESPLARMFTKDGNPTKTLNNAIRQIQDWRSWLANNLDYARRSRDEVGLGLYDIASNPTGLILLGRRGDDDPSTIIRRRQYASDLRIRIHSIDWLLDGPEVLDLI